MRIIIILALVGYVSSADINNVREDSPWFPRPDMSFDLEWILKVPKFYIPFQSKLEMLMTAKEMLGPKDFDLLDEKLATEKHCILFNLENRTLATMEGFGGKKMKLDVQIDEVLPSRWDWVSKLGKNGQKHITSTSTIVMSDKKNGILFVTQWMNGMKSFSVAVPDGIKPSPRFMRLAEAVVVHSLGFDPNLFVYSNYEHCNPRQEKRGNSLEF